VPDAGRVIGGTARGVRMSAAGPGTRALTDRVKESVFGALEAAGAFDGPFLDLFAGSGAAGIEALSRGAAAATFVEKDGKTCAVIGTNLRRARVSGGNVVRGDVLQYLGNGRPTHAEPFLAVFLDPPYAERELLANALVSLADEAHGWLAPSATVVAKHFWRDELPEEIGAFTQTRQKRFGETMISFYTRQQ
jgi:16S rRNA (guanine966-N2)-methyltransferase